MNLFHITSGWEFLLISTLTAAIVGLIPATIARHQGFSFKRSWIASSALTYVPSAFLLVTLPEPHPLEAMDILATLAFNFALYSAIPPLPGAIFLGLIPAIAAKRQGLRFGRWWFYGATISYIVLFILWWIYGETILIHYYGWLYYGEATFIR